MRNETGFYAMDAWGAEPARVAAIARHIPDAVAYVYGRSNVRSLFAYHNITTVVPRCRTPGCSGLSAQDMHDWLLDRNPARLVMDSQPYGALNNEAKPYLQSRRTQPRMTSFYLHHRRNNPLVIDPNLFDEVLKVDVDDDMTGVDVDPVLPFDDNELPTRSESRQQLGDDGKPIVLIIGEGTTPNYLDFVTRLCTERGITSVVVNTYPVMNLMVGADLVVGYVGQSQDEATAIGVPMAGITNMSNPTLSWRQNTTPDDLADQIAALEIRDAPERVTYTNRALRAAALITGQPGWEDIDG